MISRRAGDLDFDSKFETRMISSKPSPSKRYHFDLPLRLNQGFHPPIHASSWENFSRIEEILSASIHPSRWSRFPRIWRTISLAERRIVEILGAKSFALLAFVRLETTSRDNFQPFQLLLLNWISNKLMAKWCKFLEIRLDGKLRAVRKQTGSGQDV